MFVLRTLFGSLFSGILRLAVLASLLVAAYLLLAKPLLDKADDAVKSTRSGPQRVLHCVEHSGAEVKRVERCARRF
jgi:hypothetical protein